MFSIFQNGKHYEERMKRDYTLPKVTLKDIHDAVPKELYQKNTLKGLYYVSRDIAFTSLFFYLATYIAPIVHSLADKGPVVQFVAKWSLWAFYWHWQGVAFTGLWCLGHEAGHGTLSPMNWVNHVLGYTIHTFLLVPYYSWRHTHHLHHKATGSLERDENFVPRTRTDLGLNNPVMKEGFEFHEVLEETPIYTLARILAMQTLGWHAYLIYNALGNPMYPAGTNHFEPSSPLFKKEKPSAIVASNVGILTMSSILLYIAPNFADLMKFYIIPYLLCNHWIVMLTFLHHTDPTIPHFRGGAWSFLRGATATVDRPLLGWVGRFFFHNVSHDHIAHHFFSTIPFYNQPKVTEALKRVLGADYNYDDTNTFYALYRSFSECVFIEDDGDVVFYLDKHGVSKRKLVLQEGDSLSNPEKATAVSTAIEL